MWRYTIHARLSHPLWGVRKHPKINHLTLHASVRLAADVSGLQQQQRLAVPLLFLGLSAGAGRTRSESRGRPALTL